MPASRLIVILLCAWTQAAHAHHVMDYATPATALEGFLAGLGHPVIGLDHLLFIVGAGVIAARAKRGMLLPLVFVVASSLAVCLRVAGFTVPLGELWVGASLLILGGVMLGVRGPGTGLLAALFLLAGVVHGYALGEGIVGAERTPLYAYLAGLTVMQCVIAFAAWVAAGWVARIRPAIPLHRMAGISLGVAGLYFAVAALG